MSKKFLRNSTSYTVTILQMLFAASKHFLLNEKLLQIHNDPIWNTNSTSLVYRLEVNSIKYVNLRVFHK